MTTIPTEAPEFTGVTCPPWCTLAGRALHAYASRLDDGQLVRDHNGPTFGPYLSSGALEYATMPGILSYGVQLNAEAVDLTPRDLLDLASQAIAAAQWLEAHR